MDELADKLNEILGNPQQLEQIRKMASMMGLGADKNTPSSSESPPSVSSPSIPDLNAFMKIAPMLNLVKNNDETITFLMALRPLLGERRQQKLDEAIRILRVFRLFPLLKNSGILF